MSIISAKTNMGARQRGFGHVGMVVAIAVLAFVALMGIQVWTTQDHANVSSDLKKALAGADCHNEKDQDLCKFFVSFAAQRFTTIAFNGYGSGYTMTGTYETDNDKRYHIATKSTAGEYEVIGIGTNLYSRDPDGDFWWEQQVRLSDLSKYNTTTDSDLDFKATTSGGVQISYLKQDSAACTTSRRTCLKYQVTDPTQTGATRFIWFDTDYYQLQRVKTVTNEGGSDATFGYGKVSVREPSNVRKLPSNQYIVPGQSDPVTVPQGGVGGDVTDLLN